MNEKKVPQLFVASGATKWNDPKQFPWTMGWAPITKAKATFMQVRLEGEADRQDRTEVR
jgi:hypothetical protein